MTTRAQETAPAGPGTPSRPRFDPKAIARPEILEIRPYEPGKPVELVQRERGIKDVVKLASNENPLGPSPLAIEAAERAMKSANRYPDGGAYLLKQALSARLGVTPDMLVMGNGSNEIVEMITHAFVGAGDFVAYGHPTFLMYDIAARLQGARSIRVPLRDYRFDLEALADAVTDRTKVIFIANPNNPTGTMVTAKEVERFLDAVPPRVLVVLDEAYCEYIDRDDYPRSLEYVAEGRNVMVLRTFSKVYSLAALRVGYAVAHPETAGIVNRVREPFNVSTVGQAAALASLDDPEWVEKGKRVRDEGLAFLEAEFDRIGLRYVPSVANFLLVEFDGDGAAVVRGLEERGVIIRPLGAFGMEPRYARITVGLPDENRKLIAALEEILAGPGS
jgi:histidinol-phosphate aminotransferase